MIGHIGQQCCISGCNNRKMRSQRSENIHFYTLRPIRKQSHERYLQWVKAANSDRILNDYAVVCSNHFSDEDFVPSDVLKRRFMPAGSFKLGPRLKDTAVPHRNLSTEQVSSRESTVESQQQVAQQTYVPTPFQLQQQFPSTGMDEIQVKIEHFEEIFISDFEENRIKLEPEDQLDCLPDGEISDVQPPLESKLPKCRLLVPKLLECDLCCFYTDNTTQLATHMQTQHPTSGRKRHGAVSNYQCSECGIKYLQNQPEMLMWHKKNCHGPHAIINIVKVNDLQHYYQCSFCLVMYIQVGRVITHLQSYHNIKNLPFRCSNCDEQFILQGELRKHQSWCKGININPAQNALF